MSSTPRNLRWQRLALSASDFACGRVAFREFYMEMDCESLLAGIGRVSPVDNLFSFSINGEPTKYNASGVFRHVATIDLSSHLTFSAVDSNGARVAIDVELMQRPSIGYQSDSPPSIDLSQVDFGDYHVLIIGNGSYDAMPSIETATNDATEMARILENRFGFKTELILDADRYEMLDALNRKRDELTSKDNLVIYYSGHSELGNGKGHWLPVDANPNDVNTWISNVAVAAMIDSMSAKQVLVVADSVFTGTLSLNSIVRMSKTLNADQRLNVYKSVANLKARTVLTSGAVAPFTVSFLPGDHSVFTSEVLAELNSSGPDGLGL